MSLLGQPRIFMAMSRDGLLPPSMQKVHPKYRTPHVATIVTGLVAAFFAGVFPLDVLGELISIGILLAFTAVCAGVRRAASHAARDAASVPRAVRTRSPAWPEWSSASP